MLYCCCSVAKLCPTLCNPMNCSTPGFLVLHYLPEFAQTHVHRVSDAIHPNISSSVVSFSSCPQFFPSSGSFLMSQLFAAGNQGIGASASATVFSTEYSGLIFFRMDWFDLFAVQETLKSLLQQHNSKPSILWCSAFSMVQQSYLYMST